MALTPAQALQLLFALATPLPQESIGLVQGRGRILATPILADRDLPACDRSAMDGYACLASDTTAGSPLTCLGVLSAGDASRFTVTPGSCVRVFTGAPIPEGADCVVMQEVSIAEEGGLIRIAKAHQSGQHILHRGEDALAGAMLLETGTILGPAQLSVCAAVGANTLEVIRLPQVTIVPTGSELLPVEAAVESHSLRESNSHGVRAMVELLSPAQVRVASPAIDDLATLSAALEAAMQGADVVVTVGGASVGAKDFIQQAVVQLGGTVHADKMLMKPGKPVIVATIGNTLVLGLPGSPLACLTTARVLLLPLLRFLAGYIDPLGPRISACLSEATSHKPGRPRFALVSLAVDGSAQIQATPISTASVADLVAAGRADGLLEIEASGELLGPGTVWPCWLLGTWP